MKNLTKKICLLGDFSVGKTSLVRRFVDSRFDEGYISTLGVRVSRRTVSLPEADATLDMMIWDTAGSEPFSGIVRTYYHGASGALLVCDLTRPDTVAGLAKYAGELRAINPGVPLVVLGNKLDLEAARCVTDDLLAEAAAPLGAPWFLSSARNGQGVDQGFQTLGTLVCRERRVG